MKYCAHGPLELMALAWPKLHGPAKLALRPGLLGLAACARSREGAPMARDHRGGVGTRFDGSGEERGSPVRGHRKGRGRSLHGRRGAPSQGGARGGEGEAIPWPEVPVGVEALSAATAARRRAKAGEWGARRRNRGASL
jgi:hypothetical protein